MKSAIVSISAVLLLAAAGTGFAAMPQAPAYNQQNTRAHPAPTHTMPGSAHFRCPQNMPSYMALDVNNRGYVTEPELLHALQKQHESVSSIRRLASEFRQADTNHNGRLSREEYERWKDSCRNAGG